VSCPFFALFDSSGNLEIRLKLTAAVSWRLKVESWRLEAEGWRLGLGLGLGLGLAMAMAMAMAIVIEMR